jgi:hypothetical protein
MSTFNLSSQVVSEVPVESTDGIVDTVLNFVSEHGVWVAIGGAILAIVLFFLILKPFWIHTPLGIVCAIGSFFIAPPLAIAVAAFLLYGVDIIFTSDESETGTYLIFGSLVEITETWNPVGGFLFRLFMGLIFLPGLIGLCGLIPIFHYVLSGCLVLGGIINIKNRICG